MTPTETTSATDPNFFLVTSHGWSGSYWFAHSLNLHPEITCAHSAENLLAEGEHLHHTQRHKETVRSLHKGMKARQNKPLDTAYDDIIHMGKGPAFGSVHVFRLRDLPIQLQNFGKFQRPYRLANLVRHPVSFTWSGYGQLLEMFEYDIFVLRGTLSLILGKEDFIFDLASRHGLNLASFEVAAFIGAAANMFNLAQDLQVGAKVAHLPMEKLTSDQAYFERTVTGLTAGQVDVNQAYIDSVYNTGPLNKHRVGTQRLSPAKRYDTFTPWQKEVFAFFLKESDIRAHYTAFGYDFSFVDG